MPFYKKSFTVDFLSKKTKENEGEVPQYYIQNSPPAIIEPDEFDAVQTELEGRKKLGRPNACQSPGPLSPVNPLAVHLCVA